MQVPASTRADVEERPESRRAVWGRRSVMGCIALFVLAGASGLLGVRTATAESDGGGYHLALDYATVARAGLDVPWQATVTHPGGFGDSVTLAVTGDYFDIYETQGFIPDPASAARNADTLYLTFDAPGGDTFVVSYDAYIQPSSQQGRSGTIGVVDASGALATSLDFRTRLLP